MKLKKSTLVLSLSLSLLSLSLSANAGKRYQVTSIPGYVVHGINTYNGQPIGDYSQVAPNVAMLSVQPSIEEIGVYQAGETESGTITPQTDRNSLVATTRSFLNFFNPGGEVNPNSINVPLGEIGNNVFGGSFTALDQRVATPEFPALGTGPALHRKKGVVANPTVGDWEKISGRMTVAKRRNGLGSTVYITVRDAFPHALYTLWDVGARNPLTSDEAGYAVPLGGLPNSITTDAKGCGSVKIELSYDLVRACEAGAESCTSYVSAFYHWDAQLYGGSPAATWAGTPTGVYAGNQMAFPTSGEVLIEPQTAFKPRRHGCKK
ncbi:MAG: hypothetical protein ACI9SP_001655 [Arenicella sp.]|jgi:hypothetical protein